MLMGDFVFWHFILILFIVQICFFASHFFSVQYKQWKVSLCYDRQNAAQDPEKNKPYIHFLFTENLIISHLHKIIQNFLGIMQNCKLKC